MNTSLQTETCLGKIAYEAYCIPNGFKDPIPWEEINAAQRDVWTLTAAAVERAVRSNVKREFAIKVKSTVQNMIDSCNNTLKELSR